MAPVKKPAAPAGVNFLDLNFYGGGGFIPEGDYALEFATQMHQAKDQQNNPKGPNRLGVMLTAYPLGDPEAEPKQQFLSMGRNADKSFAPNEEGTGLVPVPGGPATQLPSSTNWALFYKSMVDCDPAIAEVTTNDLSVFNGIHVHLTNVPEPEERKSFGGGAMSEVDQQGPRRPGMIPQVTEIKEDGKPWEGTGGIPAREEKPKAKAGVASKPATKPATKPAAKASAKQEASDEEDVKTAAVTGIGEFLEANPDGGLKLALRTTAFRKIRKDFGDDVAQAVSDTYFSDEDALAGLLDELDFKVVGPKVVPK